MPEIQKHQNSPLGDSDGHIMHVPARFFPSYMYLLAKERGTLENMLLFTPVSLGDVVCSVPAITYAVKKMPNISVATHFPQLFEHLPLKEIFDLKQGEPDTSKFFVRRSYYSSDELPNEFVTNFNTQIVDYCSISLFRNVLPVKDKPIRIHGSQAPYEEVLVHAGKSWPSKTFPKDWWDEVLYGLRSRNLTPALIGATPNEARGTLNVNTTGCHDYRGRMSIKESISMLQNARVVITNDSSPLHMAASGRAWIGFLSTAKHPDAITHWREIPGTERVEFGWRMENLSKGWLFSDLDMDPRNNGNSFDQIDQKTLLSFLPEPATVVAWVVDKMHGG